MSPVKIHTRHHQNMTPLHTRSVKWNERWLRAICVAELK